MTIDLKSLVAAYLSRNIRERVLILVTLLALFWGVWISTFGGRLAAAQQQQQAVLSSLQQQLEVQGRQLAVMQGHSRNGVVSKLKAERDILSSELALVEQQVTHLLAKFVPADEIPMLLEDVLSSHRGLRLSAIRSQPSQKVIVQLQQNLNEELEVYRHPIQIEFRGRYADVAAYVHELETGDWQFAWRRLEYVVEQYPEGVVLLEVETLSQEKEWLGV